MKARKTGASFSKHTNHVTFSGPVRLPGVTLPAGTYTITVEMKGEVEKMREQVQNVE